MQKEKILSNHSNLQELWVMAICKNLYVFLTVSDTTVVEYIVVELTGTPIGASRTSIAHLCVPMIEATLTYSS